VKTNFSLIASIVTIGFLAATFSGSAKDEIKTFSIPKDHPPITKNVGDAPAIDVNATPVQWKTPAGWTELAPTSVRLGNFLVTGKGEKKAEVAITSFPGSVGTELDNVNRWRREIGLATASEKEIASKEIKINSSAAKLYDLAGATVGTVVAVLPRNGASWFFKLRGDKELVAETQPAFLEFLKTIRFPTNAATVQSAGVLENIAANPHAHGLPTLDPHAGIAPGTSGPANDDPKWNVPPTWKEQPPGMMVKKTFSVANDKGQKAGIAISVFPGDVGGNFANVNRWRGQMGLPPASQDEFPKVTQSLDVIGGKALSVDLKGTDAKTGKPARLVAAIVPHGEETWFYKLLGNDAVVAREKESFLKFVQTVRYP